MKELIEKLVESVKRSQEMINEQQKMVKLLTSEITYLHKSIGIIGEACNLPADTLIELYQLSLKQEEKQKDILNNLHNK